MNKPAERTKSNWTEVEEGGIAWLGTTAALRSDHLRRYIDGTSTADKRRQLFDAF